MFENASGTPNTEFSTNAIQFSPVVHITLKQDLMLLNTDDDGPQQTTEYTVYKLGLHCIYLYCGLTFLLVREFWLEVEKVFQKRVIQAVVIQI